MILIEWEHLWVRYQNQELSKYILDGFAIRKLKLQEVSFKTIHNTFEW